MIEKTPAGLQINRRYTRMLPPDGEHPVGARVYCEADHPDADQCTIQIGNAELSYSRSTFDRRFWDPDLGRLLLALDKAYEDGKADQRQIVRDALGLPNNWGGEMHGRSGR